jgi:hypothetical protein
MPDLAVHVCAAIVAGKVIKTPAARAVFYLGNCLPDLADKGLKLGAFSPLSFAEVTHTPFGVACLAFAGAMAFSESWRHRAFACLALGGILHLILDAAKSCFDHGVVQWGFPFSLSRHEFGWFHPETSTATLLPWAVGAVLLAEGAEALLRRRRPPG